MVVVAETGVDAPRVSPFADELRVEVRIHFDEQTIPFAEVLEVDGVRRRLAVERPAFDEKPPGLTKNNIINNNNNIRLKGS